MVASNTHVCNTTPYTRHCCCWQLPRVWRALNLMCVTTEFKLLCCHILISIHLLCLVPVRGKTSHIDMSIDMCCKVTVHVLFTQKLSLFKTWTGPIPDPIVESFWQWMAPVKVTGCFLCVALYVNTVGSHFSNWLRPHSAQTEEVGQGWPLLVRSLTRVPYVPGTWPTHHQVTLDHVNELVRNAIRTPRRVPSLAT